MTLADLAAEGMLASVCAALPPDEAAALRLGGDVLVQLRNIDDGQQAGVYTARVHALVGHRFIDLGLWTPSMAIEAAEDLGWRWAHW